MARGISALDVIRLADKIDCRSIDAEGPDGLGPCRLWLGAVGINGYGRVHFAGRVWRVHRLAWILANGAVPDGLVIDHLCRVRHCLRIGHLEAVTIRENTIRGLAARTS